MAPASTRLRARRDELADGDAGDAGDDGRSEHLDDGGEFGGARSAIPTAIEHRPGGARPPAPERDLSPPRTLGAGREESRHIVVPAIDARRASPRGVGAG
ncbi:hypothetical protein GCM10009792_02100 [Microcella alkalica]